MRLTISIGSRIRAGRLVLALAALALAVPARAQTPGRFERESVDSLGTESHGQAGAASLSADGRFVAFQSDASDLVPADTNQDSDVFVRDRVTGVVERVSLTWSGMEARDDSECPSLSADGRYVAFRSRAWNMYPGGANLGHPRWDVYVRDRQQGTTTRVSLSVSGGDPDGDSGCPSISGDGTRVVFASVAKNLVGHDGNGASDVFLRDLVTNTTLRLSRRGSQDGGNGDSENPVISRNGRFVAFQSVALNLLPAGVPYPAAPNFASWWSHVYVRDLETGTSELIDVPLEPFQYLAYGPSVSPAISDDGRYVAFGSWSQGLVLPVPAHYERQVYVRDRLSATTWVASPTDRAQTDCGRPGEPFACRPGTTGAPAISGDGRFVAFSSDSLLHLPANQWRGDQIYLFDNVGRRLRRLSVDPSGVPGDACSWDPGLSGDGKVLAYTSKSANLLPLDGVPHVDVFAQDWTCDADGRCRTLAACPAEPGNCLPATTAVLRLRKHPPGGVDPDRFSWRWSGVDGAGPFPDPATPGLYQICVYARSLALDVAAPDAPRCAGTTRPCWRKHGTGYQLLDPDGGLATLTLAGASGTRRIFARGTGSLLDAPYLPLAGADGIVVQLRDTGSGRCWGADFPAAGIERNEAGIAATGSRRDGLVVAQLTAPGARLAAR